MSEKIKVGISIGDVNGIGLEVIIKTLADSRVFDYCTPIVYGNTKVASFHRKALDMGEFSFNVINDPSEAQGKRANMINCWEEDVKIELGETTETGGKYAFISLERATNDLVAGHIGEHLVFELRRICAAFANQITIEPLLGDAFELTKEMQFRVFARLTPSVQDQM